MRPQIGSLQLLDEMICTGNNTRIVRVNVAEEVLTLKQQSEHLRRRFEHCVPAFGSRLYDTVKPQERLQLGMQFA